MERFGSEKDIDFFVGNATNANTQRCTDKWLNCFKEWAKLKKIDHEIEKLAPFELDLILQKFFTEVRKRNGDEYEPNSLASLQAGLDRYLRLKNYQYSILNHQYFARSRAVLEGKAKYLRQLGKGKRPNKASSLSTDEEETLWNNHQLGCHSPTSLINTLWWLFTQHFGLRGRQEHHDMRMEDFTLRKNENGIEYLTFAEGITKTRQSGLHEKVRSFKPKMFATGTNRCPIAIFNFFKTKRPFDWRDNGPFYLSIMNKVSSTPESPWFKKMPMGVNTINNIMKNMVKNSPLNNSTKKLTNHSARRTVINKMRRNNIPKSDIIAVTGHRTEAGLDAYDSGDEEQQYSLSRAIDNIVPTSKRILPQRHRRIAPNDPRLLNPSFTLIPSFESAPLNFQFFNCTVNINHNNDNKQNAISIAASSTKSSSLPPTRNRKHVIYSDELLQE